MLLPLLAADAVTSLQESEVFSSIFCYAHFADLKTVIIKRKATRKNAWLTHLDDFPLPPFTFTGNPEDNFSCRSALLFLALHAKVSSPSSSAFLGII